MKRFWKEIAKDNKRPQWAGLYVTMNGKGSIVMNRAAHGRLGEPDAFLLLYDEANHTIGLRPADRAERNAYPASPAGRHGGRRVSAYRLMKECALHIKETLEFPDAEIDESGILLLHLRTAKVSNRAINHPTRRRAEIQ